MEGLFTLQRSSWSLLEAGLRGLAGARTLSVTAAGAEVLVRHIPHRAASTTAKVDPASVAKRPCFLCRENLHPEQVGLTFGPSHALYCNPFPVVERHLTVVHRDHRPQRIEAQLPAMLELAAALPGFFVVYNGPECGASAPDHAHLQAGSAEGLPLVREVRGMETGAVELHGLRALLFRGRDRSRLLREIGRALGVLAAVTGKTPEPTCNLAAFLAPDESVSVVLFPRAKHRPEAFFTGELTVSPAAIDVAGILVAPVEGDVERLTGERVESLYREVTAPEEVFREVVRRLGSGS